MNLSHTTFITTIGSLAVLLMIDVSQSKAATIKYSVNLAVGSGSATGDIVTDGTIGPLSGGSIVDFNLLLNDGTFTFDLNGSNAQLFDNAGPGDLTATPTELLFNFSDTSVENHFDFVWGINSGLPTLSEAELSFCADSCGAGVPAGDEVFLFGDFFAPQYNFDNSHTQVNGLSGTEAIGTAQGPEPPTFWLLSLALAVGAGQLFLKRVRLADAASPDV